MPDYVKATYAIMESNVEKCIRIDLILVKCPSLLTTPTHPHLLSRASSIVLWCMGVNIDQHPAAAAP